MDIRYERLYVPGQAPVYHPDPMRSLADWGAPPSPPEPPYAFDDERAYISPGPPPWVPSKRRGVPAWAVLSIVLGGLLVVSAGTLLALVS